MGPEMKRARCEMDQKRLIELVRGRPLLWDAAHKSFNSRVSKEKAWSEVARECGGFPASVVRKKWKNLKDTYRKEYRKEFSEWHLMERLSFLAEQFVTSSRGDDDEEERKRKGSRGDDDVDERKRIYLESRGLKNLDVDVDKLIELVKLREPLWDKDDRRHCTSRKIYALWKEVADELGITIIQARYKWKYLKDTTRRELRKNQSEWLHFPKLQFIFGQFSTITYFPDEDEDQVQGLDEGLNDDSDVFKQDSECFGLDEDSQIISDDEAADAIKPEMVLYNNEDAGASSIANHVDYKDVVPVMVGDMLDEDVGFFSSLLPHVKKLDSAKKLSLRIKIQELVYAAVYEK